MAKTITGTVSSVVSGDGYNDQKSDQNANTSGVSPTGQILGSGFTAVTVPTGALGVHIRPPAAATTTKTLKGITGDTGIRIHPTRGMLMWFDPAAIPATIGLTSSGADSDATAFIWL